MDENQTNTARLNDLETSLMHLQRDYDALNGVVLDNAQRIEKMQKTIQSLTDRLQASMDAGTERQAEDEVPPHY